MNTAITGGANGIGVLPGRQEGVQRADRRGAEGQDPGPRLQRRRAVSNARLAYIGQDLFVSGQAMGKRIHRPRAVRRRGAVHRDARRVEHPAADRRRAGRAQEVRQGHQRRTSSRPARRAGRAVGDRLLRDQATPTPRATSPSTPAARRAWPRRSRSTACATRASRAAATTSRRSRRSCWPPTRSTSRSTSSPTCRASSRSCSCTCTRLGRRCRASPTPTPGLKFLDKTTVAPYNDTKSRYEGTSSRRRRHQGLEPIGRRPPYRRPAPAGAGRTAVASRAARPGARELLRAVPDAARGQHHRRHAAGDAVLLAEERPLLHARELRHAAAVLRAVRDPRGRARCC